MKKYALVLLTLVSFAASAEYASYGSVDLDGLARENTWPFNRPGPSNAMVCNVNGPDGFLSVRACPSTECRVNRALKRLAVLQVNTIYREGNWVYVEGAYRNTDEWGRRLSRTKYMPVRGWAHDGYLCSFLD